MEEEFDFIRTISSRGDDSLYPYLGLESVKKFESVVDFQSLHKHTELLEQPSINVSEYVVVKRFFSKEGRDMKPKWEFFHDPKYFNPVLKKFLETDINTKGCSKLLYEAVVKEKLTFYSSEILLKEDINVFKNLLKGKMGIKSGKLKSMKDILTYCVDYAERSTGVVQIEDNLIGYKLVFKKGNSPVESTMSNISDYSSVLSIMSRISNLKNFNWRVDDHVVALGVNFRVIVKMLKDDCTSVLKMNGIYYNVIMKQDSYLQTLMNLS